MYVALLLFYRRIWFIWAFLYLTCHFFLPLKRCRVGRHFPVLTVPVTVYIILMIQVPPKGKLWLYYSAPSFFLRNNILLNDKIFIFHRIIVQVVTSLPKLVNMKNIGTKHCFKNHTSIITCLMFRKFLIIHKILENCVVITRNEQIVS